MHPIPRDGPIDTNNHNLQLNWINKVTGNSALYSQKSNLNLLIFMHAIASRCNTCMLYRGFNCEAAKWYAINVFVLGQTSQIFQSSSSIKIQFLFKLKYFELKI